MQGGVGHRGDQTVLGDVGCYLLVCECVCVCVLMILTLSVVQMLLEGTGFTQQTEEQYFQFLAKFEIALPVASNR